MSQITKARIVKNVQTAAFIIAILAALIIVLLVMARSFIFQSFKIPSGSMIPALLLGDHVLVNKIIYSADILFTDFDSSPFAGIKRGDVVVFRYPNNEKDPSKRGIYYIQRVVGLPGDSIDIEGRDLILNGWKVDTEYKGIHEDKRTGEKFDEYEEYLHGEFHNIIFRRGRDYTNRGTELPASVPEGNVFVLGDNRGNSQDSRFIGFVPMENILGKAVIIHWSWDFNNPNIAKKVRWNRILSGID